MVVVLPADTRRGTDRTICGRGWRLSLREAQTLVGLHEVWGWSGHLRKGLGSHCGKVCGGCWRKAGARKWREGRQSCRAISRVGCSGLPMVLFTYTVKYIIWRRQRYIGWEHGLVILCPRTNYLQDACYSQSSHTMDQVTKKHQIPKFTSTHLLEKWIFCYSVIYIYISPWCLLWHIWFFLYSLKRINLFYLFFCISYAIIVNINKLGS